MAFFIMDKKYLAVHFSPVSEEQKDLLTGLLSEVGFDGFEDEEDKFSAFINAADFDPSEFESLVSVVGANHSFSYIKEENWNAKWESSFEPVILPGKVAVRASFHEPVPGVEHEIIITPKMSFGTGHHATTWLMMEEMLTHDFKGRSVFDFGTGTGILAILAEKLGANAIEAVDNDAWSLHNAAENLENNATKKVHLYGAETIPENRKFDMLIANINKIVILENKVKFLNALNPGGLLLLSGLMTEDRDDIEKAFFPLFGNPLIFREKNNWIILTFTL
ncbi:MAG: 50S ribosomal protein L11 methyltransferase [Chitinophagaceae bacterium]